MGFAFLPELGLSGTQVTAFEKYRELLLAGNAKGDLTAITAPEEVEIKHFFDSLLLEQSPVWGEAVNDPRSLRAVDVGAGAGFPGIPLKILHDRLRLDILEATGKRVAFLKELAEALDLQEVRAFHLRAEEAGQDPAFRERYDWAFSRGVASLPVLLEYCLPLLKTGGYMAAYKGPAGLKEEEDARKAAGILGGKLAHIVKASLPEKQGERCILIYRKTKPSPKQYPRKPGIPAKQPVID